MKKFKLMGREVGGWVNCWNALSGYVYTNDKFGIYSSKYSWGVYTQTLAEFADLLGENL